MTSLEHVELPTSQPRIALEHAIGRGEYAAIVFCGATDSFGELLCETTSAVGHKYVLEDPRLDQASDLSSTAGGLLPRWPLRDLLPTSGVCFVFVDEANPHCQRLKVAGGIENEHFLVLENQANSRSQAQHDQAWNEFVSTIGLEHDVVLLGYGDQGKSIALQLVHEHGIDAKRLVILDHGEPSRQGAVRDGFRIIEDLADINNLAGVIMTPLMHHGRLHVIWLEALTRGLACFDNAIVSRKVEFFESTNGLRIDAQARRSLGWAGSVASPHPSMPSGLATYRHDDRQFDGVRVAELHRGVSLQPLPAKTSIDVKVESSHPRLEPNTWVRNVTTYVAHQDRRAFGVYAARDFCRSFWPQAVDAVFPSSHPTEMGATDFERMLRRHVDGCEYITASQTSAQQAALGIVAWHYASDSPIIEIGSALGGSALLMALATNEGAHHLHSIDPDTATRDVMRFAFEREGQIHRLRQHIMTSEKATGPSNNLPEQAGLVFIDGLHTYDATLLDFNLYAGRVRPGGALLIHDVTIERYSVWRVYVETILKDQRFKAIALIDGLAIMERRKDEVVHDGS